MKLVRIKIFGKVHGVGFRNFVYKNASKLEIKGWVKNNIDGTVEALFEGKESDIEKLLELCKKGPENADVKRIEELEETEQKYKTFEILHSTGL